MSKILSTPNATSKLLSFNEIKVASDLNEVYSPAFDVTPSHLISGIITEETVYTFPYNFLQ